MLGIFIRKGGYIIIVNLAILFACVSREMASHKALLIPIFNDSSLSKNFDLLASQVHKITLFRGNLKDEKKEKNKTYRFHLRFQLFISIDLLLWNLYLFGKVFNNLNEKIFISTVISRIPLLNTI